MGNPVKDALPNTPGAAQPILATRQALALAIALPLKDGAAVTEFHAIDLAADGTPYPALIYDGTVFGFDAADTTTAHDPDGGCITDASGRRYKREAAMRPSHMVLDKDLSAPPSAPAQGDAYLVAAAATGAWSGHDGEFAIYGARGWSFRIVAEGEMLWVDDEGSYYHKSSAGTLVKGLGDLALANSSIEAKHLAFPFGMVVTAAQAAPPASPADRACWLVIATASGAWAGQENKVAEWDSAAAAWVFHTPQPGNILYDVAAGYQKQFGGSAWARLGSSNKLVRHVKTKAATRFTLSSSAWTTVMSIPAFAPASLANVITAFGAVEVKTLSAWSSGNLEVGLFVDSELLPRVSIVAGLSAANETVSCPLEWLEFNPTDLVSRIVHVKAYPLGSSVAQIDILAHSSCRIVELEP